MNPNPLTTGPSRAPARAMLKAVGFTDADLKKPLIGVANTWIEIGPCNFHLRDLAVHVKEGIRRAGGTPMEFNTVSISDGITMGTEGMRASLVSREVIADSIELVARGNGFDGAGRAGRMRQDHSRGVDGARQAQRAGAGAVRRIDCAGQLSGPRRDDSGRVRGGWRARCRTDDRCRAVRPRSDRVPGRRRVRRAVHREHDGDRLGVPRASRRSAAAACRPTIRTRPSVARAAGERVMDLVRENLRPRDIMTKAAFENAIASVATTGGSTNAVLHLMAIAHEAGVDLALADFDRISGSVPLLADLKPSGRFVATDLHAAGGSAPRGQAAASRPGSVHADAPTVTGRTMGAEAALGGGNARPGGRPAGQSTDKEDRGTGHPARLAGARGRVVKLSGTERVSHRGPARVFDSEEATFEAVQRQAIQPGDVVIIRYEGPSGGPGMREMLAVTARDHGRGDWRSRWRSSPTGGSRAPLAD